MTNWLKNLFAPRDGRASFRDVNVRMLAVCHACNLRHRIDCGPDRLAAEVADWEHKHPRSRGCRAEYVHERHLVPAKLDDRGYNATGKAPWFLAYGENTNFNFVYRASSAITNAITALGTSPTWVAGYESETIDNSSNKDLDILVSAKVTVGTTPTINTIIEVSSVSMMDDSTWPDVFDGTTSAETVTSAGVKAGICLPLGMLNVDATTTNRVYYMSKRSIASLYGGICPDKSVLFTSHNSGVNLKTEAGTDHQFFKQSVYIIGA